MLTPHKHNYLCIAASNGLFVLRYWEEQLGSVENINEHVIRVIEERMESHSAKHGEQVKVGCSPDYFGSLTMIKILAVGISGRDQVLSLCAKLWLRLDIVPFVTNWKSSGVQQAYANALKVDKYFNAQSRSEFSSSIAHAAYLHCLPSLGWQYEVKVRRRLPPLPLP